MMQKYSEILWSVQYPNVHKFCRTDGKGVQNYFRAIANFEVPEFPAVSGGILAWLWAPRLTNKQSASPFISAASEKKSKCFRDLQDFLNSRGVQAPPHAFKKSFSFVKIWNGSTKPRVGRAAIFSLTGRQCGSSCASRRQLASAADSSTVLPRRKEI